MRVLITGGAGFIGSHLAESLLCDGHEVVVVDDLSTGQLINLESFKDNSRFEFILGDILKLDSLDQLISGCDLVYHLAAAVGVELVVHDPVRTIVTNVNGTENILRHTARYGKKIIVASTSEVYGKSNKMHFSEHDDLLIGSPMHSRWSYACSKLLDEFFVMAHFTHTKMPGTIVRLFNTVGPRQTGRYGMVVPRFVEAAMKDEPLKVFGNGNQTRCFCHVYDTVRALRSLGKKEDSAGHIFNIGSTHQITINELAQSVISRLGSKSEIVHIPYDEAYEKGFEDMLHRAPNIKAINDFIGWKAEHSLDKIIDDVATYQRNQA